MNSLRGSTIPAAVRRRWDFALALTSRLHDLIEYAERIIVILELALDPAVDSPEEILFPTQPTRTHGDWSTSASESLESVTTIMDDAPEDDHDDESQGMEFVVHQQKEVVTQQPNGNLHGKPVEPPKDSPAQPEALWLEEESQTQKEENEWVPVHCCCPFICPAGCDIPVPYGWCGAGKNS